MTNRSWDDETIALFNKLESQIRQQQVDLKIANDYSYILERKLKEAQAEIEALKKVLQEVVRISDRNHGAWNKAKELLK